MTTEKPFIVGETVGCYVGEDISWVEVLDVNETGDIVTVNRTYGLDKVFYRRESDGRFVIKGHENHAVMPTMIFHPKSIPAKLSIWETVKSWF